MGRKVHPKGFRLKVIREWDARWYAEGERYVNLLMEDRKIRKYLKAKTTRAGVSRIEIERHPNLVIITINTVRPGLIIGRKGVAEALTTFGQIGVKVWIYKGDILPGEDPFSSPAQRPADHGGRRGRRN